ncbi:hypothetical protein LINPERPRIM_LOCUS20988 [Linum perenne]
MLFLTVLLVSLMGNWFR